MVPQSVALTMFTSEIKAVKKNLIMILVYFGFAAVFSATCFGEVLVEHCGSVAVGYEIDGFNGRVDTRDFAILANRWLKCIE